MRESTAMLQLAARDSDRSTDRGEMNKSEMVEKVAAETGGTNAEASRYANALLGVIEEELKRGGEVNITGFGKFSVQERAAREGVNPQTGKKMQIKASKTPKFSAGNALKDAIN